MTLDHDPVAPHAYAHVTGCKLESLTAQQVARSGPDLHAQDPPDGPPRHAGGEQVSRPFPGESHGLAVERYRDAAIRDAIELAATAVFEPHGEGGVRCAPPGVPGADVDSRPDLGWRGT